jgi:hypothetical protein
MGWNQVEVTGDISMKGGQGAHLDTSPHKVQLIRYAKREKMGELAPMCPSAPHVFFRHIMCSKKCAKIVENLLFPRICSNSQADGVF